MTTILVTGYEPFGEYETNPSRRLAEALDGETIGGAHMVGRELPVVFDRAFPALLEHLDEHDPEAVLSLGLMAGTPSIAVERIGINVRDHGDVPDNADQTPVDDPVVSDGPAAYFSTLPVRDLVDAMTDAGVPARLSNTAGTHLCNDVLYATRHHAETNGLALRSGFVHVPFTHEEVARRGDHEPSLSFEAMADGLEAALSVLAETA